VRCRTPTTSCHVTRGHILHILGLTTTASQCGL
jgi:hypothetical protein